MFSHRVSILTGHYGTGKTEVSVNLALALAAEGEQVMLADLDIVNPLFPLSGAAAPPGKDRCAGDFLLPGLFGRGCPRPAGGAADHSGEPGDPGHPGYRRRSGGRPGAGPVSAQDRTGGLPADLRPQRQPAGGDAEPPSPTSGPSRPPPASPVPASSTTPTCAGRPRRRRSARARPWRRRSPVRPAFPFSATRRRSGFCRMCQTFGNLCSPSP